jgi:ABC-type branched-subunit amino acid transport system substrate-binding protein
MESRITRFSVVVAMLGSVAVLAWSAAAAQQLKPVPGFDGSTIKLGLESALTGPGSVIALPSVDGGDVWWQRVNAHGGIAGKYKVEIIKTDHQNLPSLAVQRFNQIRDNIVLVSHFFATHTIKAALPTLRQTHMVAAPVAFDSDWVHDPQLIPVGSTYQIQSINAMDYYVKQGGGKGKKICAFIRDDPYGQAGLEGVVFAGKQLGYTLAVVVRYALGDQDFIGQVNQLKREGCEAVFLGAIVPDAVRIMGTASQLQYAPRWIAMGPSWSDTLTRSPVFPYMLKNYWVALDGPEWGDQSSPGMQAMLKDIKTYKPDQKPNYWFMFGYAQAQAVQQVLEEAVKLGDLGHEGIIRAVAAVGTVDFGGLLGSYTYGKPADRVPPRESSLFKPNPAKPYGLQGLRVNQASETAKAYVFP